MIIVDTICPDCNLTVSDADEAGVASLPPEDRKWLRNERKGHVRIHRRKLTAFRHLGYRPDLHPNSRRLNARVG